MGLILLVNLGDFPTYVLDARTYANIFYPIQRSSVKVPRMVDLQMISVTLAALGFLVGTTYYILILRNANKTRRTQLFMNMYNRFNDKDFARARAAGGKSFAE